MQTPAKHQLQGVCPSCHSATQFRYVGEQRYPERVAQKLNMPLIVTLWNCLLCHTTVSENEIALCAE